MGRVMWIFFLLLGSTILFAGDKSYLYEVQKGGKKLGSYEIVFLENGGIETLGTKASSKVPFFLKKELRFFDNGHKSVVFYKNKKAEGFHVYTSTDSLTSKQKKQFERKLKKVKNKKMLLILKDSKHTSIELFNKRETTVKTFDELLFDATNNKLTYNKAILFDKNGVMKMVIKIEKNPHGYTVINSRKNKPYMRIDVDSSGVQKVQSLVSNWGISLKSMGEYKSETMSLEEALAKVYTKEFKTPVVMQPNKPIKLTKTIYSLDAHLSITLPKDIAAAKNSKQTSYCKKLLKSAKLKHKKLQIKEGVCATRVKTKLKRKKTDTKIISMLFGEFPELKTTRKVAITKKGVEYKTMNKGK